jgi:ABC-type tungstate transport system permease subunit
LASGLTGRATDHVTIDLINAGPGGSGTSSIASITLTTSTDLTKLLRTDIDATLAYEVAAGDVIQVQYTAVGTGIAMPACQFELDIRNSFAVTA